MRRSYDFLLSFIRNSYIPRDCVCQSNCLELNVDPLPTASFNNSYGIINLLKWE